MQVLRWVNIEIPPMSLAEILWCAYDARAGKTPQPFKALRRCGVARDGELVREAWFSDAWWLDKVRGF
jgi:hypothetical protein